MRCVGVPEGGTKALVGGAIDPTVRHTFDAKCVVSSLILFV